MLLPMRYPRSFKARKRYSEWHFLANTILARCGDAMSVEEAAVFRLLKRTHQQMTMTFFSLDVYGVQQLTWHKHPSATHPHAGAARSVHERGTHFRTENVANVLIDCVITARCKIHRCCSKKRRVELPYARAAVSFVVDSHCEQRHSKVRTPRNTKPYMRVFNTAVRAQQNSHPCSDRQHLCSRSKEGDKLCTWRARPRLVHHYFSRDRKFCQNKSN